MPIDPSIALQARLPQFDNPLTQMAQVSQLQQAQKQNRLADLMFAGKEREMQQETALSQAYKDATDADGNIIRNKLYTGLARGGLGAKLPGIQKGFAEQDKSQREAERAALQQAIEKQAVIAQYAGAAKDQASWSQGLAALQSMGVDVSQVPQQFDPQTAAMLRDRSLTGAQQLEQVWKTKEFDLDERKFGETKRSNQESERTAQANLGLKREEVGLKRQEVSAGGKPPPGYRWKGDGTLEPIPGGPAIKASQGTEGEKTAAGYGMRMQEAEKILADVIAKDQGAQKPGKIEQITGGTGVIANMSRSPERQRYRQAQEDWVRAKLRKESGAVIADEEMDREISVYFPQIGDSKEVIQQKAQARQVAIAAMEQAAGQAAGKANVPPSEQGADIDALLKKYGG